MLVIKLALRPQILVQREQEAGIDALAALPIEAEQQLLHLIYVDPRMVIRPRDFAVHCAERVQQRLLERLPVGGCESRTLHFTERSFERALAQQQAAQAIIVLNSRVVGQVFPDFRGEPPAPVVRRVRPLKRPMPGMEGNS